MLRNLFFVRVRFVFLLLFSPYFCLPHSVFYWMFRLWIWICEGKHIWIRTLKGKKGLLIFKLILLAILPIVKFLTLEMDKYSKETNLWKNGNSNQIELNTCMKEIKYTWKPFKKRIIAEKCSQGRTARTVFQEKKKRKKI